MMEMIMQWWKAFYMSEVFLMLLEKEVNIILAIIQYSSWPIVAIVVAITFKKQISSLKRVRIKDYEIELGNEIKEIAKEANEKNNRDWKITSIKFLESNMLELAEKSPLAVVIEALEIVDNNILLEVKMLECYEKCTVGYILHDLYTKNIICKQSINLYFRIVALKTKMCNFENENVTKNRAIELADIALSIINEIRKNICNVERNN